MRLHTRIEAGRFELDFKLEAGTAELIMLLEAGAMRRPFDRMEQGHLHHPGSAAQTATLRSLKRGSALWSAAALFSMAFVSPYVSL